MLFEDLPRLPLAHLPTPLWRHGALDRLVGAEVWVKRDDLSEGAAAGNKIRKLEYLLAEALQTGKDTIITCGGAQSNPARATALCCAKLGLTCLLILRSQDAAHEAAVGNLMLDYLAGAEVRWITPEQDRDIDAVLASTKAELEASGRRVRVIPKGGSNARGAMGYVRAMGELRRQLDAGEAGGRAFDAIVHACGSGGTAAGVAVGAARYEVASRLLSMAVCDDSAYFTGIISGLATNMRTMAEDLSEPLACEVVDDFKGPAYGEATAEQLSFLRSVARRTGLVLDPVYSGKALHGLSKLALKGQRVLFIHTGGLPGLLAQADRFE